MRNMRGQRVLITGAARGIGLCTAEQFANAGSELVLSDLDQQALEHSAAKLRALGATVHTFTLDVSQRDQVEAMAQQVIERLGGLDVLINNAGIGHTGELAATSIERWKQLIDVNLWGPLYHIYAFLPWMMEHRSGHIVNVSSGQAFFRMPSWGAYATTKLALGGFSEILHYELAPRGIRVTTVYPFLVNTGFYSGAEGETLGARLSLKLMPLYSDSPERVGKVIFKAVKKRKKVEMVNHVNRLGFYSNLIPPVSTVMAKISNWALTKGH